MERERDEIRECQADIIEATLTRRGIEARVTGGVLHSRWVRFQVAASPETSRWVEALAEELAQALDVETCHISLQDGGATVQIPRSDPQPVRLLSLLTTLARRGDRMPFATAVVGLTDDVRPLLLRLPSAEVGHVLITGAAGSGKSALARAIVVSMALHHRRSRLSFVLIGDEFGPLAGLSGLLRPVVRQEETARALRSLVGLMDLRVREGRLLAGDGRSGDPRVVVVIDELALDAHEELAQLVRQGHEAGIHLVVCTKKPAGLAAGGLAEADFPLRLVGQSPGREGWLPGDFVAVTDEWETHFCAAYISAQETAKVMAKKMRLERGLSMKAPPSPTVHRRPGRPGGDRPRRPVDRMRAVRRWRDEMAAKARQKTATRTAAGQGGAEMAPQLNQTQHRPDALAERIEEVLRGRGIQARVAGGNTYPDRIQFHVVSAAPPDITGLERIEGLAGELPSALGVETCHVSRHQGLVAIDVPYAARPAQLPPLQKLMAPFQAQGVALLGTSDGKAVPVRLFDRDVRHLFLVGTAAGGRNHLTRSVVASLAASHSQRQLSFVLIAPGRRSNFGTLAGLPHLWGPVLSGAEETLRALDVLDRRILSGPAEPRTVVVIDDLADLLAMPGANGRVSSTLRRMTQRGHEAGVHVVACSGRPGDPAVQELFRTGDFPVRLVGWMASPGDAGAASHYAGRSAGRLPGLKPGDFIIAAGGQAHVCRAAHLTGSEIAQLVMQMKKHSYQFNTQVVTHPWGVRVVQTKRRKQPQVGFTYTMWLYFKLVQYETNRLFGRQKKNDRKNVAASIGKPQTHSAPDTAGVPGR